VTPLQLLTPLMVARLVTKLLLKLLPKSHVPRSVLTSVDVKPVQLRKVISALLVMTPKVGLLLLPVVLVLPVPQLVLLVVPHIS
jgi:hypothetical protein